MKLKSKITNIDTGYNGENKIDKKVALIEYWYDRHLGGNWIIQKKNKDGDQLGEAIYEYNKKIAKQEADKLAKEYNVKAIKS